MAWETATPDRLGTAHRTVAAVTLAPPGAGTSTLLPALRDGGLTVTFDETTAPYATAACTVPASSFAVDLADPLNLTHLQITAGYEWADGTVDTGTLCRLPLIRRGVTRPAGHVRLEAAGVEVLAQNYHVKTWGGLKDGGNPMPGDHNQTLGNLFSSLVAWPTAYAGLTPATVWPAAFSTPIYDLYVSAGTDFYFMNYFMGDNLWSLLEGVGTTFGGHRVYGDELGRWAGRTAGNRDHSSTHMRIAPGSNLVTSEATIGYTDFHNVVVDEYSFDVGEERRTVIGRASLTSGPYSIYNAPQRVKYARRDVMHITQEAASAAAARRVRNLAARRSLITVEAVADYRVRPKHRIALRLPTWAADESWVVQAVTFTPATGRMKLTLRRPIDDTATITTTGE